MDFVRTESLNFRRGPDIQCHKISNFFRYSSGPDLLVVLVHLAHRGSLAILRRVSV